MTGLIQFILILAVLGLCLYLLERFVPMAEPFRILIRVIVAVVVIIYLLKLIGVDIGLPALFSGGGLSLPSLR